MTPFFSLANIRAGYGESVVLDELSLDIAEGEIICLLGVNGAGKTTTTRVAAGLLKPWRGEITLDRTSILDVPAHQRVELGISLSPEGRQIFPDLTVIENLLLGSYSHRARPYRKKTLDEVFALFPKLLERGAQKAGLMSGGEQQMLALARALMARPRLLILDEPSLGLAPKIVIDFYAAVAETAKAGISILIVEQNAEAALSAAHRGYVLAGGRIEASGTAAELRGSSVVREAFLGKLPVPSSKTPKAEDAGSTPTHQVTP